LGINGTDRKYFESKFNSLDTRIDTVHDDVLVIKTERKMEKKVVVFISAGITIVLTSFIKWLGG